MHSVSVLILQRKVVWVSVMIWIEWFDGGVWVGRGTWLSVLCLRNQTIATGLFDVYVLCCRCLLWCGSILCFLWYLFRNYSVSEAIVLKNVLSYCFSKFAVLFVDRRKIFCFWNHVRWQELSAVCCNPWHIGASEHGRCWRSRNLVLQSTFYKLVLWQLAAVCHILLSMWFMCSSVVGVILRAARPIGRAPRFVCCVLVSGVICAQEYPMILDLLKLIL